jgi:hypothetical protein
VVEKAEAHERRRPAEVLGAQDVSIARSRVRRWMIVGDGERSSIMAKNCAEDLANR